MVSLIFHEDLLTSRSTLVWSLLVSKTIKWALLVSRSWILCIYLLSYLTYLTCTWGATNQHVINAALQITDVQIWDAEEGSCKDTKKILVLSLIFDNYYELKIYWYSPMCLHGLCNCESRSILVYISCSANCRLHICSFQRLHNQLSRVKLNMFYSVWLNHYFCCFPDQLFSKPQHYRTFWNGYGKKLSCPLSSSASQDVLVQL